MDHDVFALDVSVDDSLLVALVQGFGDVPGQCPFGFDLFCYVTFKFVQEFN